MNRLVWMPAVVLISILGVGCQSTKFPSPKWPDIALFKKKDKELAPPSQHFDVAEQQQLADSSTAERKPTQIPGESTAGAIKPPSDQAKPTAPMVAAKSGTSAAPKTSTAAGNSAADSAASSQPIRKPYELAKSSADSLNQAASAIASDVERNAVAAKDQINRNANEVVGQFQQQGRELANAAGNSINQAAATLNQSANNALNLGSPATANSSPANSSPAGSGGAFAFSRPTAAAASSGSLPPWSNPAATANAAPAGAPANSPLAPSNPPVDPLKSLAASSALTPSTPSANNSSPPPSPFTPKNTQPAERQLQPINQQLVNQNLGAPAQDSASSQFQLPVAQPPTFVANRSAAAGNSAFASTSPGSSPQANPIGMKTSEPPAPTAETGRQPPVSGNPSSYPSTGFNAFVAAGSAAPKQNGSTAAEPGSSSSAFQPETGKINSGWQTQANSVAPASQPTQPSANRPVSHTAELPAELMQRSGSYAPGSVGGDSSSQTLWR